MCGFASAFRLTSNGSPKYPNPLKILGNELISNDSLLVILSVLAV